MTLDNRMSCEDSPGDDDGGGLGDLGGLYDIGAQDMLDIWERMDSEV